MDSNTKTVMSFLTSLEEDVPKRFLSVPGAESVMSTRGKPIVFVPGTRDDRILLVAHYDTVPGDKVKPVRYLSRIISGIPQCGIGADDRAGCAILWLMRGTGHSLLLCPDEETGGQGAVDLARMHLKKDNEVVQKWALQAHTFALEFDRRGAFDLAHYNCATDPFYTYMLNNYPGYSRAWGSFTDITVLGPALGLSCLNLSVGYYNEHCASEALDLHDFSRTIYLTNRFLKKENHQTFLAPVNTTSQHPRVQDGNTRVRYGGYLQHGAQNDYEVRGARVGKTVQYTPHGRNTDNDTDNDAEGKFFGPFRNDNPKDFATAADATLGGGGRSGKIHLKYNRIANAWLPAALPQVLVDAVEDGVLEAATALVAFELGPKALNELTLALDDPEKLEVLNRIDASIQKDKAAASEAPEGNAAPNQKARPLYVTTREGTRIPTTPRSNEPIDSGYWCDVCRRLWSYENLKHEPLFWAQRSCHVCGGQLESFDHIYDKSVEPISKTEAAPRRRSE